MATGTRARGLSTAASNRGAFVLSGHGNCSYAVAPNATAGVWCFLKTCTHIFLPFSKVYSSPVGQNGLSENDIIARVQLVHFPSAPRFFPCVAFELVSSVWARRGHDANILTCDWLRRSCGWVDVNARYKRACKEPRLQLRCLFCPMFPR